MTLNLCQYKNIFGESGKGVHSIRIFGLAFVDLFLTVLLAIVIREYFLKKINLLEIFIYLWILGIFLHLIFCVNTPITNLLN
jgi:hypothetical protein